MFDAKAEGLSTFICFSIKRKLYWLIMTGRVQYWTELDSSHIIIIGKMSVKFSITIVWWNATCITFQINFCSKFCHTWVTVIRFQNMVDKNGTLNVQQVSPDFLFMDVMSFNIHIFFTWKHFRLYSLFTSQRWRWRVTTAVNITYCSKTVNFLY